MIFVTFIFMAVAVIFGAPLLPILIVAALLQGGAAFIISRNQVAIRLMIGVALTAVTYFIQPIFAGNMGADSLISPVFFEYAIGFVAVTGLIAATIIGVLGQPGLPNEGDHW